MTFLELAKKVIEEENRPLSVEEIWLLAQEKGYDKSVGSKGKTPAATIGAQIYVNMRDKPDSPFLKTDTRPQRFYLKHLSSIPALASNLVVDAPGKVLQLQKRADYLERDLHPLLAFYAQYYLKAYTRTILHNKSDKKEYGEWVHPDMVGCYFPIDEWKPEVLEFSATIGNVSIKLYSFEIKKSLSFSNLRESFFQTVSNSSWANESYLVAAEISSDEDFHNELKRLSTSFGIGVVKLDTGEPDSSEIVFPARYNEYLD
ncbi:MAG: HTH domain-containing protein [Pyrinomonadaceae bacterium]